MSDWLYRYRDPVALGAAALLMVAGTVVARSIHSVQRALAAPATMEVTLETIAPVPVSAPEPPPPMPAPKVVPSPSPAPRMPAPLPTPDTAQVRPDAQPAPAPVSDRLPVTQPIPEPAPRREPPVADASPRPVAPPTPAPAAVSAEMGYAATLKRYLESIKRYPSSREARQLRPTGTVRVWIELDRNGQLREAGIEQSSGMALLDQEALRTARNGRYPVFPEGSFANASSHRFVFALEYRLDAG